MISADKLNSPEMTGVIIGSKPNTYTFTKSLAENILETEGAGLPISIIRPSIVAAAWRDPFPGSGERSDLLSIECRQLKVETPFII